MQHLISRLPAPFGRPLGESDFHSICEREKIAVVWGNHSFYCSCPLGSFIQLDKRLKGIELLFTAFHELGHHFANTGQPISVEWSGMPNGRDEYEADAIALIALVPANYLHRIHELLDLAPRRCARKIYRARLRLYFLFGV